MVCLPPSGNIEVPPKIIALDILLPTSSAGKAKPNAPVDVTLDTGANGPAHSIYLPIVAPCANAFADSTGPSSACLKASIAPNDNGNLYF